MGSQDQGCYYPWVWVWYILLNPFISGTIVWPSSPSPAQGFLGNTDESVPTSPPTPRMCRHLRLQPPLVWIDLDVLI